MDITNGSTGSITLDSTAYLETGTITTNENATFKVTSVQGVNLADYSTLQFEQQLTGGVAASLELFRFLDSLDPQHDGISVSLLKILGNNSDQMTVYGTLKDSAGNSRQVSLTFTWSNP